MGIFLTKKAVNYFFNSYIFSISPCLFPFFPLSPFSFLLSPFSFFLFPFSLKSLSPTGKIIFCVFLKLLMFFP